jgi:hypothetical protein
VDEEGFPYERVGSFLALGGPRRRRRPDPRGPRGSWGGVISMFDTTVVSRRLSLGAAVLCVVGLGVSVGGGASTAVTAEQTAPTSAPAGRAAPDAHRVSANPSISARGRHVAFDSTARLVRNDTNGVRDVYVRDRSTGTLQRVSVSSAGRQGTRKSFEPAISGNGRYVAFTSRARLVAGDTNGRLDVYVRDRSTGTTELVSVSTSGEQGDGPSYEPAISSDGNVVAFTSDASNLAAGTNAPRHVYVRIRSAGVTRLASVTSTGTARPGWYAYSAAVSANGRYVAFTWDHEIRGLRLTVWDRAAGTTQRVATASSQAAISASGRFVSFTRPISTGIGWDPAGQELGKPYDVLMRDRSRRATRVVSVSDSERRANSGSFDATMSARGGVVAFTSIATNLVVGDTNRRADVFVRDRSAGRTLRVSVSTQGGQGDGASRQGAVSANGRYVAFTSNASNLVARDPNGHGSDVFVRDLLRGRTQLVSARDNPRPDHLDPAALPRGADPEIAYLVRDTIRDGELRVRATSLGRHEKLWTVRRGYLLQDYVPRRGAFRLVFVGHDGKQTEIGRSPGQISTAVSPGGNRVAWARGRNELESPTVVKVADPSTGRVLASRRFPWAYVFGVSKSRVLLTRRGLHLPVATLWWNYERDTLQPISGQAGLRAYLEHNRIVLATGPEDSFCNRVAPLSDPSRTLWRSCRLAPHAWSPSGARTLATHTYLDDAGTDFWRAVTDRTGDRVGRRIFGRFDWEAVWENDAEFLTLAQGDRGHASVVRCTVDARCERASRLWFVGKTTFQPNFIPPPVVLSSN